MPELMLMYRSASMFGRLYAPDVLMGMHDEHENRDIGTKEKEINSESLTAEILEEKPVPVSKDQLIDLQESIVNE